jgi:predicted acyltransferase
LCSLALGYFWALWFPLNKNMWTSSFVLVASGYSLALLTFAFWAIEVKGWRMGWTGVWLVFGSNAIAAYMFSELLPGVLNTVSVPNRPGQHATLNAVIFSDVFAHIPDPHWAAFAYSVTFTAVCFIPVLILYRKKIFLKI